MFNDNALKYGAILKHNVEMAEAKKKADALKKQMAEAEKKLRIRTNIIETLDTAMETIFKKIVGGDLKPTSIKYYAGSTFGDWLNSLRGVNCLKAENKDLWAQFLNKMNEQGLVVEIADNGMDVAMMMPTPKSMYWIKARPMD